MQRALIITLLAAAAAAAAAAPPALRAQRPPLHVSPRWKECAIQLSPSLTQAAWRRFTRELAVVGYFRPLTDARPLGRRTVELSLLQWRSGIDENAAAWNDTFVHPDSTHWLIGGGPLPIIGLAARAGVSERVDAGVYYTRNPEANYGLVGGQIQVNVMRAAQGRFAASTRLTMVRLVGPEDVAVAFYGADLVASHTVHLTGRVTVSPYASVTALLSTAHERSAVVSLADERVLGAMGSVGAAAQIGPATLAVQYDVAAVSAVSFRIGVGL
jgi:hypothetical protein